MSIYVAPALKAGPIGSGAGVLLTEFPLMSILGNDPARKMRTAYQIGMQVPWIRRAESLIGARVSTVDFDLDDPEDTEIDEEYPNADAVAAWTLLNRPQAHLQAGEKMTRSQLWRLTSRHLGLCGNAFWLLDQPEAFSGTPAAIAYIRPDRMSPDEDAAGNLVSWHIDRRPGYEGIKVELAQIVHFMLEPPDTGHFGPGLVETALLRGRISTAIDQHLASVLSAGGRISGIMAPKSGIVAPEQGLQLERDWRGIVEQPDAAKRLQLVNAPVDFIPTTMTINELGIVDLMKQSRDDLFIFWGVPGGVVGVPQASGLNGGESRKYDEAALWQGPVHDRLVTIGEGIEDGILSLFTKRIGWEPTLDIEEPEFDDDSPRYDLLGKSINIAMTNAERRQLVGKDPFGVPEFDDAVWMPATMVPAFNVQPGIGTDLERAPGPMGGEMGMQPNVQPTSDAAMSAAGETTSGKAVLHQRVAPLRRSLLALRDSITTHHTPRITETVRAVLADQRRDIAARIRAHADAIARKPRDATLWFDAKRWDRELANALSGGLVGMATSVSRQVADVLSPAKAEPMDAVSRVLLRGAARVTKINAATRDEIAAIIATAIEQEVSLLDVADALAAGSDLTPLIGRSGGIVGDLDYRSEMIARTELMDAYNASTLGAYGDAGLDMVQAIDGDGDPECAARNGEVYPLSEAEGIEDHPNGTLDWVPVIA